MGLGKKNAGKEIELDFYFREDVENIAVIFALKFK